MKTCECCKKDSDDNWEKDPCCADGLCCADTENKDDTIAWCTCCGAEMFKEDGIWYHHSQKEMDIKTRGKIHLGI